MNPIPLRRYQRYVAIGDSSTEGLDDPDGRGGYRGWANRLAEHLARAQGGLLHANLAIRGRRGPQIREEQLDRALSMSPDLVTFFSGTNDVVGRRFDIDAVAAEIRDRAPASRRKRRPAADLHLARPDAGDARRPPHRAAGGRAAAGAIREISSARAPCWSISPRIRWPPTRGYGAKTGCTPMPRATRGSPPRSPTRSACRMPTPAGPRRCRRCRRLRCCSRPAPST